MLFNIAKKHFLYELVLFLFNIQLALYKSSSM